MAFQCLPSVTYLLMGIASSLSLLNVCQSTQIMLTTSPNKRKIYTFTASIALLIACVLNSEYYLLDVYREPGRQPIKIRLQIFKSIPMFIALCLLSVASAHRYFAFHSEHRKEFLEMILTIIFVADCMFAYGISSNTTITSKNRLWLAILLVIPLAHVAFGAAMYMRHLKDNVGKKSAGYDLARWQVDLNLAMIFTWIGIIDSL
jgi:hypothetical protein